MYRRVLRFDATFEATGENSMHYVDGFVAAVPSANKDVHRRHAEDAAGMFKEHGALSFVECWGAALPDFADRRRTNRPTGSLDVGSPAQRHAEPRLVAGAHHAIAQDEAAIGHVTRQVQASVEVEVAGRR